MSIKSDRWIRRMAAEHRMIEPFEPGQVRVDAAGERIVSYGTSSYGYDVRCAPEFKIFTNINSSIVDPKSFDSASFVDVTGDTCVIPPNSFALARTVEYFRIPRSVLTICLGKSTYARCFSGDTRVALADGRALGLEDMARRAERGERFFGYGMTGSGRIVVTELEVPRLVGRDALLEIELDNGRTVRATPDHEFLLRDGTMRRADDLRVGASLMPLYRSRRRGREMTYQPVTGRVTPTRRLADAWTLRHGAFGEDVATGKPGVAARESLAGLRKDDERYAHARHRAARSGHAGDFRHSPRHEAARPSRRGDSVVNHEITGIRELPGDHDVYCLTVPATGNFALEAGVFVSNCGIIVNVTPLEPEWEGHVTLEFSNTTPLPAKIYAHEGIAQMLFLESDETCETSYADRGGKYQGQEGVTLPRT